MDDSKRWLAAVSVGGLVLVSLIGCGREESVASKSAAAFREAQKRGEAFGGQGHGHGAATPGGGEDTPEGMPAEHAPAGEEAPAGEAMRHGGAHGGMAHPGATPGAPGKERHGGHAAMEHGTMEHGQRPAAPSGPAPEQHAGHGGHRAVPREAPPAATPPAGHAGHASSPAGVQPAPSAPAPAAVPPGQPAATLRPDPLDAPAASSVADAQRAAALAQEMAGDGHGGHGAGTYRQIDAGRASGAQPESQEHEEHDHDPPAERRRV